jgi:hypothetical protein
MPTGRHGRLWALILMPVALASVHLLVVAGLVKPLRGEPVGPGERMLFPRLKASAEELPGLRAQASELSAAAVMRKAALEGAYDAISSANVQSRIEELAASVGATVSSTEGPPAEVRGAYRRVGLRHVLSSSYDARLGAYGFRSDENPFASKP